MGVNLKGPTAAINSIAYQSLLPFVTGCPIDIYINPNEVEGNEGINRLSRLLTSFMDLGGTILTLTDISEDIMRDTQKNPDLHRSLRLRLGGLSAILFNWRLPPRKFLSAKSDMVVESDYQNYE